MSWRIDPNGRRFLWWFGHFIHEPLWGRPEGLFVDAPESREQLKRIGQELGPLGLPLLFNAARTLKSPIVPADELKALGFGIIIYPIEGLLTMMKAVEEAYRALLREGSTDAILPMAHTFRDINEMLDMPAFHEREQGYTDNIAA